MSLEEEYTEETGEQAVNYHTDEYTYKFVEWLKDKVEILRENQ